MIAAIVVFCSGLVLQYLLYSRVLVPGLDQPDAMSKKRTLTRWFSYNAGLWAIVVLGSIAYVALERGHANGYVWILPAVGAVLGTGLPMQLSVLRIARAALS